MEVCCQLDILATHLSLRERASWYMLDERLSGLQNESRCEEKHLYPCHKLNISYSAKYQIL
jgi:hypothetical protein